MNIYFCFIIFSGMKVTLPEVTSINLQGIWSKRNSVNAVFVKKHNLQENLKVVQNQTKEQEINLNPEDWLFLLEGRRKYLAPENLYLDSFVDEFNISTCDPIVEPFTSRVASQALVENEIAALSVFVFEYLDYIKNNEEVNEDRLKTFLDDMLNLVARNFNVSSKKLQDLFLKMEWNTQKFWESVEELKIKREKLIDISNQLSRQNLVQTLGELRHPNVFIFGGIAHKPVFGI